MAQGFRVDFFVLGMSRSGSTSTLNLLGQHPEIFVSSKKETSFFNRDEYFSLGPSYYQKYFEGALPSQLLGEASTEYSLVDFYPETPARLFSASSEAKLILTLRDPVDRAVSIYFQLCRLAYVKGLSLHAFDFEAALNDTSGRWNFLSHHGLQVPLRRLLVDSGNYSRVIQAYQKFFSKEQIKVLFYSDLQLNPVGYYRQITDFLGVTSFSDEVVLRAKRLNGREAGEVAVVSRKIGLKARRMIPLLDVSERVPLLKTLLRKAKDQLAESPPLLRISTRHLFKKPKERSLQALREYFSEQAPELEEILQKKIPWNG